LIEATQTAWRRWCLLVAADALAQVVMTA